VSDRPSSRLRAERVRAEVEALCGRVALLLREFEGDERARELIRHGLGALREVAVLDASDEQVGPRRLVGESTRAWLAGVPVEMPRNRGPR
jgi:hypothetical protein